MTELTQADYQAALTELNEQMCKTDDEYNGSICGYEGEMILSTETVTAACHALTLAARVPQTMDAPVRTACPVSVGDVPNRETGNAGASFDCGELDADMPAQELRLHMGELKPNEILVARAAIRWANSHRTQATFTDAQVKNAAKAIASVRYYRVEVPAGNTQSHDEYVCYMYDKWFKEARAALSAAWGLK